jgi:DNA-binding transcriptional MerR regulator
VLTATHRRTGAPTGGADHVVLMGLLAPTPSVTGVSPDSGPATGGTSVVVSGSGFTGATAVLLFGVVPSLSFSVVSDSEITVTSPPGVGTEDVHVLTLCSTIVGCNLTRTTGSVSNVMNQEYRIDELAQLAGTTVRNIRAYQDRGLLPAPRRVGRVGLYSGAHLARLRLIGQMLSRGYSLANIAELLAAWEGGQDLGDLLGLEAALTDPWSEPQEAIVLSLEELAALFGVEASGALVPGSAVDQALADGFVRREADGYVVDSPRLLRVGAELVAAGIPVAAVLERRRTLRREIDTVAATFVDLIVTYVFEPLGEPIPASEVPRLAELVRRLRPLAGEAVAIELADALQRQVQERLGQWMERILEHLGGRPVSRAPVGGRGGA